MKIKKEKAVAYDSFLTNMASSRTKVIAAMTATTSTYVWVPETLLAAELASDAADWTCDATF